MIEGSKSSHQEIISSDVESQETQIKPWSFLVRLSQKLDAIGIEQRGIERVLPNERVKNLTSHFISIIGFWVSASCGLTTMSSFILCSTTFELTFKQSLLCGLVSQFIGSGVAAYCSIMGAKSGCRQMVTARYLFGWWFVKFISFLAIIGGVGWSVVNCVVGGGMLAAISNDKVPVWIGIVIVGVLTFIVSIFGIKQVLISEKYMSIPMFIFFMLLYISASDKYSYLNEYDNSDVDSLTKRGNWLSFFSLCYSVTATWGSCASDYHVEFPEDTPSLYIFILTFCAIGIPSCFVAVLGLMLGSLAASEPGYIEAYDSHGMGGVLDQGFSRWNGFGKFCSVILLLSLVCNNVCNSYSACFSIQLISVWFAKVPRWVWAIVITVIYLCCALVGRDSFSDILSNFLPMIGYWVSIYFTLLVEENVIFRRGFAQLYTKEFPEMREKGILKRERHQHLALPEMHYNWGAWNDISVLTQGFAAIIAFGCGAAGVVVGMAQVYYIGPIAIKFGEYGADLGMWLSMAFAATAYPILRYWELRKFGR